MNKVSQLNLKKNKTYLCSLKDQMLGIETRRLTTKMRGVERGVMRSALRKRSKFGDGMEEVSPIVSLRVFPTSDSNLSIAIRTRNGGDVAVRGRVGDDTFRVVTEEKWLLMTEQFTEEKPEYSHFFDSRLHYWPSHSRLQIYANCGSRHCRQKGKERVGGGRVG